MRLKARQSDMSQCEARKSRQAMRLKCQQCERLTLWLTELALLDTRLQGPVEENIEHLIGSIDVVVGLDIFLQSNTAIGGKLQLATNFKLHVDTT